MALSRDELKKQYAEQAKTIGTRRSSALAETITQMVEPNRLTLDIFRSFMTVEQLNPGDNVERRVRRGKYNVRTFVPGANQLTDKVSREEQVAFMFERLIAGASVDAWAVQTGDVDSVEKIRSDLGADLIEAIASRVFTLLGTLWSPSLTPNNYADATSSGLTSTVFETMVENIVREAGTVRAVIGTREALLPVYKFAGYKEYALNGANVDAVAFPIVEKLNEFANTARVSSYYGVPLIELPNTRRNRLPNVRERVVDSTKVIFVGENPGTIALMGGVETHDFTDMQVIPPVYYLYAYQAFSMLIDAPENIGVVKVSAAQE